MNIYLKMKIVIIVFINTKEVGVIIMILDAKMLIVKEEGNYIQKIMNSKLHKFVP